LWFQTSKLYGGSICPLLPAMVGIAGFIRSLEAFEIKQVIGIPAGILCKDEDL
jgi:hypothetical protein